MIRVELVLQDDGDIENRDVEMYVVPQPKDILLGDGGKAYTVTQIQHRFAPKSAVVVIAQLRASKPGPLAEWVG